MDNLNLFIIAISVILAVVFKWYLFRRIQRWIDQDLIKGLADGDHRLLDRLHQADHALREQGRKRAQRHKELERIAADFSSEAHR
ncbi:MAG: hypothetical protein CMI01_14035 [Oceanospirillaceae bacterium]|jgi:hypothetical protein|uniref:hypothetical protein n=1 Tax=Marinobacterium litorale TaxID=404770 RepID=UPI00040452DF|nr:hypothetical protein [Marinobacterium litorale]MBS99784.1 hypothetical protein [Oceanospirillaceae bacterium]